MLYAFAAIQINVFLDLSLLFGAFFVDGNADIAARRGHGLGLHASDFALDIKVAHFAEVKQALVELGPFRHATLVHIMSQVIDYGQAGSGVEIGRASCRERWWQYVELTVGAVELKKK